VTALRGAILNRAQELAKELKNPDNKLPFDRIIECHIGNPQGIAQTPITFIREVLSGLVCPGVLNSISRDAKERAERYLATMPMNSIGGYSDSHGVKLLREEVADFIAARDGEECRPNPMDIFLTHGGSAGVHHIMSCLLRGRQDGVVIPIPQYPLYSAVIALRNGSQIQYDLDEEKGWAINFEHLRASLDESITKGIIPRAIVVVNPANPTGKLLYKSDIEELIRIAHD